MRITERRLRRIIRQVIAEGYSAARVPPGFEGILDCEENINEYGGFTISYSCRDENECALARISLETDLSSVWKKHDVDQYIEVDPTNPLKLLAKYPRAKTPDDSFSNRVLNIGLDMDLFNRR